MIIAERSVISWTWVRQEEEMLATRRAPWGDLYHNDPYLSTLDLWLGWSFLQVMSFHSSLTDWVNLQLCKQHQYKLVHN